MRTLTQINTEMEAVRNEWFKYRDELIQEFGPFNGFYPIEYFEMCSKLDRLTKEFNEVVRVQR